MNEEMIRKNFKDWPICDNCDYYVGDVTDWMNEIFGTVDEAYIVLGYYYDDKDYKELLEGRWFCCANEYKAGKKFYCPYGTLVMKLDNGKYFKVDIKDDFELFIQSVE